MDNNTEKTILQAYKNAPKDIQEAITSSRFDPAIQDIIKKYRLHIDQGVRLHNEAAMLMLGITRPDTFVRDVAREVGVSEDIARGVAADVNERIFKPIKESLKKLHGVDIVKESIPAPSPVAPEKQTTEVNEIVDTKSAPITQENTTPPGGAAGGEQTPSPTVDIVAQKLSASVVSPIKETVAEPQNSASSATAAAPAIPLQKYTGIDPYRETPE